MLMSVSVPQPPAALEYPWIQGRDLHGLGLEMEVMQNTFVFYHGGEFTFIFILNS